VLKWANKDDGPFSLLFLFRRASAQRRRMIRRQAQAVNEQFDGGCGTASTVFTWERGYILSALLVGPQKNDGIKANVRKQHHIRAGLARDFGVRCLGNYLASLGDKRRARYICRNKSI
jgi:hypothetical protein